jgi:hypothetical protein
MGTIWRLLLLVSVVTAGQAKQVRLTGVLYSNQSGPSASGTGEVILAVGKHAYHLEYQKPIEMEFSSSSCQTAGSIWTVDAVLDGDYEGRLLRAKCAGQKDISVFNAVGVVERYFDSLERGRLSEAYGLLTRDYQGRISFEAFVVDAKRFDLALYRAHRQGQCLEISKTSPSMQVRAGPDCLIRHDSEVSTLEFVITTLHPGGRTEISEVIVQ